MSKQLTVQMVRQELNNQLGIVSAPPESHGEHHDRIVCPACNHERVEGRDRAELAVFIKPEGWLNFHCHHCQGKSKKGDPPAYPMTPEGSGWIRAGFVPPVSALKQEIMGYQRPLPMQQRGRTPHIETWWGDRKILKATRDAFGVFDMDTGMARNRRGVNGQQLKPEWLPCVVFPYFDFNGQITNYKKRSCEKPKHGHNSIKREWRKKFFSQSPNNEPRLYNEYHFFRSAGWRADAQIIIVEGELDVLSIAQAFPQAGAEHTLNVVSLPSGSAKSDNRSRAALFTSAYQHVVDRAQSVILAGDNDANGRALMSAIADVFGRDKCRIVEWGGFKDANETLMRDGAHKVTEAVWSAIPMYLQDTMYPPETLNAPVRKVPTSADPTDANGSPVSKNIRAMLGLA
ncbi:MAG: toprim domain-containing protein [Proteobacteria bacterium]|nr:toprim domain-containing protein [Pseudomonadota bacterium]